MGRQAIKEMNRLGMVVDMSHAGERTTLAAIDLSERPIAVTHANPTWWCPGKRGKSRPVLKALGARHGMLGLSLYPHHLEAGSQTTLESFCRMAAEAADVVGTANLGIGSDLRQGQPDLMLRWMREGRWSRAEEAAPAFPPQPPWFQDNRDFPRLAEVCAGPDLAKARSPACSARTGTGSCAAFAPAPALHRSPVAAAAAPASLPIATAGFMAMKGAGYYSKSTLGPATPSTRPSAVTGAIERMQLADDGSLLRVADLAVPTAARRWRRGERTGVCAAPGSQPTDRDRLHRSAPQRFQPAVSHDPQSDRAFELLRRGRAASSPSRPGHRSTKGSFPTTASISLSPRPPRTIFPRYPAPFPITSIWSGRAARNVRPMRSWGAANGRGCWRFGQTSWRPAACWYSSISASTSGVAISATPAGSACSTRSTAFGASLPMRA